MSLRPWKPHCSASSLLVDLSIIESTSTLLMCSHISLLSSLCFLPATSCVRARQLWGGLVSAHPLGCACWKDRLMEEHLVHESHQWLVSKWFDAVVSNFVSSGVSEPGSVARWMCLGAGSGGFSCLSSPNVVWEGVCKLEDIKKSNLLPFNPSSQAVGWSLQRLSLAQTQRLAQVNRSLSQAAESSGPVEARLPQLRASRSSWQWG